MKNNCLACQRIEKIKDNTNPFFVAELKTGFVVMGDYQTFKGYTVFICKKHVLELQELPKNYKNKYLIELGAVGEAIYNAFKPRKLDYELLGNDIPHLHWHIFPRHKNDPIPKDPTWLLEKRKRMDKISANRIIKLKVGLLRELRKSTTVVRSFDEYGKYSL